MNQVVLETYGQYDILDRWFIEKQVHRVLLVCGKTIEQQKISIYFSLLEKKTGISITRFSEFHPNPEYESVVHGVRLFHEKACDSIIAVGGGSAIDVAKCIKLFCNMQDDRNYLEQVIIPNAIPFLAIPTTSGTGSESTRFAVIYYQGVKQSVDDPSCIPDTVLLDGSFLVTLPLFQKKCTMLDALSHSIESFWSVNSTEYSMGYSETALKSILAHKDGYLANAKDDNIAMLWAANQAGRAINITQTTAGHAMCYSITSLFGCPHGYAAALCNRALFPWMIEHVDECIDPRGSGHLKSVFHRIAKAMECDSPEDAGIRLNNIVQSMKLDVPSASEAQLSYLKSTINPGRLKNHPIRLDDSAIDLLYRMILNGEKQ